MYKDLDKLIDSVANRVKTPAEARNLATTVWMAAGDAGLTICNLKPLAELLGCEPEIGVMLLSAKQLGAKNVLSDMYMLGVYGQVARALNWERTEFDTLDELLAELRASEEAHSKFVDSAIQQNELMETVREKLRALAELSAGRAQRPLIDELLDMLEPRKGGDIPARATMNVVDALNCLPPTYNCRCVLRPVAATHAVLHGTEYYPGSTILLQTAQLVAWRDADGQEHCERAHRVTLNPDRDGLAAAILSGIAGAQIAPEHIAELRAQMGGDIHG